MVSPEKLPPTSLRTRNGEQFPLCTLPPVLGEINERRQTHNQAQRESQYSGATLKATRYDCWYRAQDAVLIATGLRMSGLIASDTWQSCIFPPNLGSQLGNTFIPRLQASPPPRRLIKGPYNVFDNRISCSSIEGNNGIQGCWKLKNPPANSIEVFKKKGLINIPVPRCAYPCLHSSVFQSREVLALGALYPHRRKALQPNLQQPDYKDLPNLTDPESRAPQRTKQRVVPDSFGWAKRLAE